jgi:hypothetical protein
MVKMTLANGDKAVQTKQKDTQKTGGEIHHNVDA